MPDVPAALGRKYGPLPGYGWVGVTAVGTFLLVRRARKKAGGSSSSAPSLTNPGTATDNQTAYGTGYSDGYGAGASYSGPSGLTDYGPVGVGGSGAVTDPTTGTATPPAAIPGTVTAGPIAPVANPAPVKPPAPAVRKPAPKRVATKAKPTRVVSVHKGDTLAKIAARNHVSLRALEKANPALKRGKHNWGLIFASDKVRIP